MESLDRNLGALAKLENASEKPGKYFQMQLFILKVGGIKLVGQESYPYTIYAMFIRNLIYSYPFVCLPNIFYDDIQQTLALGFYQVSFFIAAMKSFVLYLKRKRMSKLLMRLEQAPFVPDSARGGDFETKMMENFVWISSLQARLYWIPIVLYYTLIVSYVLIQRMKTDNPEEWSVPFVNLSVVDTSYSPVYEMVTVYQVFSAWWLSAYFITIDLLIGGLLCNITYQLRMLQNYLQLAVSQYRPSRINRFDRRYLKNEINTETQWIEFKSIIKTAVNYHREIINFVAEVEDMFSMPLLFIFVNNLAVVAGLIYLNSVVSALNVLSVRRLIELSAAVFQAFLICYWGERVQEESENVGRAAYDVCFAFPYLRLQDALNFILLRSQAPIKITAGKFSDIGFRTFAWILRASYSTFMLLRRTQLKYAGNL